MFQVLLWTKLASPVMMINRTASPDFGNAILSEGIRMALSFGSEYFMLMATVFSVEMKASIRPRLSPRAWSQALVVEVQH